MVTTKKSMRANRRNRFQMKKDHCQWFYIPINGKYSIQWNKDGFTFWKRKGTGLIKPYKKKELNKLLSQGFSAYRVTVKYEIPVRYYILITIVNKKRNSTSNKVIVFDTGMRTFQTGFNSDGNFVEYLREEIKKQFALGKRMDALKYKIDKHYKASCASKKKKTQYKNRRM
jgi:hypothetical protein